MFDGYWRFGIAGTLVVLFLFRMIFRERITLQGSLAFLGTTAAAAVLALWPSLLRGVSNALGFTLPSNFLFVIAVGILMTAHLSSLVSLSRLEMRTVTLTQELGILREEIDRMRVNGP